MAATPDADNDESSTTDQIDVTFTGENKIKEIACEGGLSTAEVKTLVEMIEEDPAWLQSPADGATDLLTGHSVDHDVVAQDTDNGGVDSDSGRDSRDGAGDPSTPSEDGDDRNQ